MGNDEREQTLNQLLTELDGFDSDKVGAACGRAGVGGLVLGALARGVMYPSLMPRQLQHFVDSPLPRLDQACT